MVNDIEWLRRWLLAVCFMICLTFSIVVFGSFREAPIWCPIGILAFFWAMILMLLHLGGIFKRLDK